MLNIHLYYVRYSWRLVLTGQRTPWHTVHECYYIFNYVLSITNGENWIGLKSIHCLTSRTECTELKVTLADSDGVKTFATSLKWGIFRDIRIYNGRHYHCTWPRGRPCGTLCYCCTSAQLNYYPSGTDKWAIFSLVKTINNDSGSYNQKGEAILHQL